MFDNQEDVMDLNEARLKELYLELSRMDPKDPKYKIVAENIEILSKVRDSEKQTELRRLDNNAKMDIEEQRLIIEQQKLMNDKARTRGEWIGRFVYGILVMGCAYLSYDQDMIKIASKPFVWAKENFLRRGF